MGSEARMMEASRVIDAPAQKIFAFVAGAGAMSSTTPELEECQIGAKNTTGRSNRQPADGQVSAVPADGGSNPPSRHCLKRR